MPDRGQLLMPTSDVDAAKLIEIEALRSIADNLKRLNDSAVETGKTITDVRERLIRIESNRVDTRVEELEKKVEDLERDKYRRDGAMSGLEWVSKFGPWLLSLALAILALMGWDKAV